MSKDILNDILDMGRMADEAFKQPTEVKQAPSGDGSILGIIQSAANKYGIDPEIMTRLAQRESSLNPSAKNPQSSAGGLFQFIDKTWDAYGNGQDKFDPSANADAAARMLKDNLTRFNGDYAAALAAHHVGPEKAQRALVDGSVGDVNVSTQSWLKSILSDRQKTADSAAKKSRNPYG